MVVTNVLGIAFTATVLAASDAGVTFVFPEDGATNRLAWAKLSPASQAAVCAETRFTPIPPLLAGTYLMAETELKRIRALSSDGRMSPEEAADRRQTVMSLFAEACRSHGVSKPVQDRLFIRLLGTPHGPTPVVE